MAIERVTTPLLIVIDEIISAPTDDHYGYGLHQATGLAPATVQRILTRLEDAGLLTASWEDIDPHVAGRRPKRLYRLTGAGEATLREILVENRDRLRRRVGPTQKPQPRWSGGLP